MDELVLSGKKYISSKRASELTGYAKDYVGQLARGGKIPATRVGRAWYVDETALLLHENPSHVESAHTVHNADSLGGEVTIYEKKVAPAENRIASVSHVFLRSSRELPNTWSAVEYSPDDSELLPTIVAAVTPKITKEIKTFHISDRRENTDVRIKVLQEKVNKPIQIINQTPHVKRSVNILEIKPLLPEVKNNLLHSSRPAYVFKYSSIALVAVALIVVTAVVSSGLLVSSHIVIIPGNGIYSANASVGFQHLKDAVASIPELQTGFDCLNSFFSFLIGSSNTLFWKGANFLNWVIHLV